MAPGQQSARPRLLSCSSRVVAEPSEHTCPSNRKYPSHLPPGINRCSHTTPRTSLTPMRRVERWAGSTRTVSNWDGLRRDPELWYEHGDCLVHLYAVGQSRRGPSFCVPFHVLKKSNCGAMFSLCFARTTTTSSEPALCDSDRSSQRLAAYERGSKKVELFIPAPEDAARDGSFRWHITTRNFFAWLFGRPLVGVHLGQAMVDLQERMRLYRSGRVDNHQDFLNYADKQGYRNLSDFPDYALAILYYAEHYKLRNVWMDAFAHCVGMNERLVLSPEFLPQSRLTKALITRASLEMDIELGRTTRALRDFLEDDLSPAYLGLTEGARYHLDRFRSFLHSFYVDKFGYWPPPRGTTFSKALYRSLYFDFKNMYDYLLDSESTADLASQKLASGGICVLQNVSSFDKRHKFPPLPHPMPLLPCQSSFRKQRTESQRSLKALTLGSKQDKEEQHLSARAALIIATNRRDTSIIDAPIIQAYMRFERQCAITRRDEKVSITDARKVRWLLIYGTLQYLISALRAPAEVRDTEVPQYFMCCLVADHAQWQNETQSTSVSTAPSVDNSFDHVGSHTSSQSGGSLSSSTRQSLIEPDCQNYDYLLHTNTDPGSRRVSVDIPAPLKISQSSKAPSVRSRRRLSLSSLGSRRNSIHLKPQVHCEILVHGYGNGLNETSSQASSQPPSRTMSFNRGLTKHSSQSTLGPATSWLRPCTPDSVLHIPCEGTPSHSTPSKPLFARRMRSVEWDHRPTVDSVGPESITPNILGPNVPVSNSPESLSSHDGSLWTDSASSASSKSSTHDVEPEVKLSPAEESGLLGGFVPVSGSNLPPFVNIPVVQNSFQFGFDQQPPPAQPLYSQEVSGAIDDYSTIGIALTDPPSAQATETPHVWMQILPTIERGPDSNTAMSAPRDMNRQLIERRDGKPDKKVLKHTSTIVTRDAATLKVNVGNEVKKSAKDDEGMRKKEKRKSFWRR